MFDIFKTQAPVNSAILLPSQLSFTKRGIVSNVEKVITYSKIFHKPVKSDHFLIRLLQSIAVPKTLELERYYANVDARALGLSMTFQMTSSIYKGSVHKGIFYGTNNTEILIATDDVFDIRSVAKNWRDVSAVTVIQHPKSDLGSHIPDGRKTSNEDGLAIILINIPMLAVQYRSFILEQMNRTDDSYNIMQFVGGFVLPNMLRSHIELCLFNRVFRKFYGITSLDNIPIVKHSFTLMNYTNQVDILIDEVLKNISISPKQLLIELKTIPGIYKKDMLEALRLPDIAPTRAVHWALMLSRLKAFSFLVDLSGPEASRLNQAQLNQAMRSFGLYDTYNLFNEMLPNEIYFEASSYIDNILAASNKTSFK